MLPFAQVKGLMGSPSFRSSLSLARWFSTWEPVASSKRLDMLFEGNQPTKCLVGSLPHCLVGWLVGLFVSFLLGVAHKAENLPVAEDS